MNTNHIIKAILWEGDGDQYAELISPVIPQKEDEINFFINGQYISGWVISVEYHFDNKGRIEDPTIYVITTHPSENKKNKKWFGDFSLSIGLIDHRFYNQINWYMADKLNTYPTELKVKDLQYFSLKELSELRNVGKKTIKDVLSLCEKAGIKLKDQQIQKTHKNN